MKLNHECVRSIMLELEEKLTLEQNLYLPQLLELETSKKYGKDTSVYTVLKLIEADFINGSRKFASDKIIHVGVSSITWDGHEFLDNIRDKNVWEKTKEKASGFNTISISILSGIAQSYISSKLGLNN